MNIESQLEILESTLDSIAKQAQETADHGFFGDPHGLRLELKLIAKKARDAITQING
jgi:hypothetical protein